MDYTFEDPSEFSRQLEREAFAPFDPGVRHYDREVAEARQVRAGERIAAEQRQEEQDDANFRAWERENERFFVEQDCRVAGAVGGAEVTRRFQLDRYQVTGNHFQGR